MIKTERIDTLKTKYSEKCPSSGKAKGFPPAGEREGGFLWAN